MVILCRKCSQKAERSAGRQDNICRSCAAAYGREYRAKNLEALREKSRQRHQENRQDPTWVEAQRKRGRAYWKQLRHEAIMAYGGYECVCCGETTPEFLSLDHANNDGAAHRRSLGYRRNGDGASSSTLRWLKANGYPAGFQVLCMNCNFGKAINKGVCPHEAKPLAKTALIRGTSLADNPEPSPIVRIPHFGKV